MSFLVLVHWNNNLESDLSLYSVRGANAQFTASCEVDRMLDPRSSQTYDLFIFSTY
jgi:hypothetical protein